MLILLLYNLIVELLINSICCQHYFWQYGFGYILTIIIFALGLFATFCFRNSFKRKELQTKKDSLVNLWRRMNVDLDKFCAILTRFKEDVGNNDTFVMPSLPYTVLSVKLFGPQLFDFLSSLTDNIKNKYTNREEFKTVVNSFLYGMDKMNEWKQIVQDSYDEYRHSYLGIQRRWIDCMNKITFAALDANNDSNNNLNEIEKELISKVFGLRVKIVSMAGFSNYVLDPVIDFVKKNEDGLKSKSSRYLSECFFELSSLYDEYNAIKKYKLTFEGFIEAFKKQQTNIADNINCINRCVLKSTLFIK